MHHLTARLGAFFLGLGLLGPLFLGILDSSFLFTPFGNDLLIVVLTARKPSHLPFYVLSASLGSTIGVFFLDLVCRKGGAEGLKHLMNPSRQEYFKRKIGEHSAAELSIASLAPPPFPFTLFVAAASAFQYPRPKLLGVIAVSRVVRFTIVGLIAVWQGRRVLAVAKSSEFMWAMVIFIAICLIGSGISVVKWARRPRT